MVVSEELINEIRRSVNIVDVVSDYIPVEQKGRNYFALCPFHDDHNPSMSISPDKQIYTCFVCGAHGNVFNFVMDYEHVSFIDAVKMIGRRVGVNIDLPTHYKKPKEKGLEDLYNIYDIANKFYQNNLSTKEGNDAREYLSNRDFKEDVIKEFGIGLSLNNKLSSMLLKKYDKDILIRSGICNESGGNIFDAFTERIMFPLWDIDGNVVGFSGRIYKTKDSSKYVNSKESDIFKKGKLIYNYHRAKEEVRKKKFVLVVEGFMDVIALYKVGIKNVVAMMGTAVTNEQANLLKRLSTNIFLCFDGDSAGNMATMSCANELTKVGITPKVIRLPENLDPDEYIKKYGSDNFNDYLDNPKSLIDYKMDYYKNNTNFNDSIEVSKYIKDVVSEIDEITDPVVREIIIKKLSDETDVSVATIKGMVKGKDVIKTTPKKSTIKYDKYKKAEMRLIYYMLRHKEVINIYERNKCFFPTDEYRALVSELVYYYKKHGIIYVADFLSYISDKKELLDAFNKIDTMELSENYTTDEIMDYINLLNEYGVNEEFKRKSLEFKKEIDEKKKIEIAKEMIELRVSE
ncbi:dNA primase [Clostridium sp. CAG:1193]|nr:dNA primase [Clostridium sp. CAG:1193]